MKIIREIFNLFEKFLEQHVTFMVDMKKQHVTYKLNLKINKDNAYLYLIVQNTNINNIYSYFLKLNLLSVTINQYLFTYLYFVRVKLIN